MIDGDRDGDGVYDPVDAFPADSIRSVRCDAGQYGRYICLDSPAGKYVPTPGSMYATEASRGYFVPSTGQSSQIACAAGTFQPDVGQTSCDDADAGFHVPNPAQTSQTACQPGTYQPLQGQPACRYADAGYYVDETAAVSQTACDAGTFNPNTGSSISSACVDADPGHYVPTQGQLSRPLVQLEPINPIQVEHPAMMPMLGSMSQSRRKRAKQPARSERTSLSKGNHPAMTQMQDTMWMKLQEQPKQPVMPAPSIRTRALQVPVLVLMPIRAFCANARPSKPDRLCCWNLSAQFGSNIL